LCPSDMYLVVGRIQGYNNEIEAAATAMLPGTNQRLNTEKLPSIVIHSHGTEMVNDAEDQSIDVTPKAQPQTSSSAMVTIHENNKTFLTVAAIGVGLDYYMFFR